MGTVKSEQPYAKDWQEYKKLRKLAAIWLLAFMSAPLAIGYVSVRAIGSLLPAYIAAIVTMAGWAFYFWRFLTFPCPQCGEIFGAPLAPLLRRCRRCGLTKWATRPNGRRDP
jgi:hypothetical protein